MLDENIRQLEREVGDIQSCIRLIRAYMRINRSARVHDYVADLIGDLPWDLKPSHCDIHPIVRVKIFHLTNPIYPLSAGYRIRNMVQKSDPRNLRAGTNSVVVVPCCDRNFTYSTLEAAKLAVKVITEKEHLNESLQKAYLKWHAADFQGEATIELLATLIILTNPNISEIRGYLANDYREYRQNPHTPRQGPPIDPNSDFLPWIPHAKLINLGENKWKCSSCQMISSKKSFKEKDGLRCFNPHRRISRDKKNRWKCNHCKMISSRFDDFEELECTQISEPCKYCGDTPICAIDCIGVAAALSGELTPEINTDLLGPGKEPPSVNR